MKPDLFSTAQRSQDDSLPPISEPAPPLPTDKATAAASPSYALPTNLPSALRHLDDDQLERLLAAVIAERQARSGKELPLEDEPRRQMRIKEVAVPLAQGKLNAVRAAFIAGVRPSRIARQFGVSLSDVRKALAGDQNK
jgi:hypothetical protein